MCHCWQNGVLIQGPTHNNNHPTLITPITQYYAAFTTLSPAPLSHTRPPVGVQREPTFPEVSVSFFLLNHWTDDSTEAEVRGGRYPGGWRRHPAGGGANTDARSCPGCCCVVVPPGCCLQVRWRARAARYWPWVSIYQGGGRERGVSRRRTGRGGPRPTWDGSDTRCGVYM